MSRASRHTPNFADVPSEVTTPHEPRYLAARVRGRSDDVRRAPVDGQRPPSLSRNPSTDSNFYTAREPALPIPEHRSRSVGAAALRPPSVNHTLQSVFARNSLAQRSESPQTTINPPLALGQTLPFIPQRRSGTPQPSVGSTHANPRPTGTVVVTLYPFHILTGNQEPDF